MPCPSEGHQEQTAVGEIIILGYYPVCVGLTVFFFLSREAILEDDWE